MLRNLFLTGAIVVAGAWAVPAHAQTIVEVAQSDDDFSALVDAVVDQGLVDTLNSDGPFTVFAPTNDAFADLPDYLTNTLASEPDLLTDILLYHVVPGEFFSGDVLNERTLSTAQSERLRVNDTHDGAFINRSELIALDIDADNGVVHVVDRVLVPRSVYRAVIADLRQQINELRADIHDVRRDGIVEHRSY